MLGIVLLVCFSAAGTIFVDTRLNRPVINRKRQIAPGGIIVFVVLTGSWLGLILLSTLSFWLTWLFRSLGTDRLFPLGPERIAGWLTLGLSVCYLIVQIRQNIRNSKKEKIDYNSKPIVSRSHLAAGNSLLDSLAAAPTLYLLILALAAAIFLYWLLHTSFHEADGYLRAGASVFSDLSPHTALTSAFAQGANIPPDYPHFAADGINYHFFFFHLAGMLVSGGLPIHLALNLLTWFGLVSFLILLGLLAWRLTGRRGTILLAPFLAIFRSSLAFFSFLAGSIRDSLQDQIPVWEKLLRHSHFIGDTPKEDWGLWSINVYANQRHLPTALAVLMIILLLQSDNIRSFRTEDRSALKSWLTGWLKRDYWLTAAPKQSGQQLILILFLILLPYWHGSVFLSALMLLFCLAMISDNRLYLLIGAVIGTVSALLQNQIFSNSPAWPGQIFQPGFISENRSLPGILHYLLELTGILLPLIIIVFLMLKRLRFWIILSSCPLVFAFLFSLTPDVTVNHKLIMITIILWSIPISGFLLHLPALTKQRVSKILLVIATWLLIFVLTISGIYECLVFHNLSQIRLSIPLRSELTDWIEQNTAPDAVFLTAPAAYHQFFLTGRRAWYGHPYYAWSAGHDTEARLHELEQLAVLSTAAAYQEYLEQSGIDAVLIDDEARNHPDISIDEGLVALLYPLSASFPNQNNSKIYVINPEIFRKSPLHR